MKIQRSIRYAILAGLSVVATTMSACGEDTIVSPRKTGPLGAAFPTDASSFSRVDRMGMPGVATVVITSKDAYNQADPTDDAAGTFVGEIVANVDFLHTALDDDLTSLGLTPCATLDCVGQAAPFVVPDVVTLDTSQPPGFPNGRLLTDPVIDITLALILLDLNTHPVTTLIGLNPTANDKPFLDHFPYLRRPHKRQGMSIKS